MTQDLRGVTVLVTRPEHQQDQFNALLKNAGAACTSLPCIGVRAVNSALARQQISSLNSNQTIIFTSTNAVNAAHKLAPLPWPQMCTDRALGSECTILAIGPATADALRILGVSVSHAPEPPYNSESLLSMDALKRMNLQKVSIIKGRGGRDFLARTLLKHAKTAETIEVYERFKPEVEHKRLEAIFLKYAPDIVTITSNEALQNLFELVTQPLRERLLKLPLVVNSPRGAKLAKDLCFQSHVLVATAAGDYGQLEAIKLWNSTHRFKL